MPVFCNPANNVLYEIFSSQTIRIFRAKDFNPIQSKASIYCNFLDFKYSKFLFAPFLRCSRIYFCFLYSISSDCRISPRLPVDLWEWEVNKAQTELSSYSSKIVIIRYRCHRLFDVYTMIKNFLSSLHKFASIIRV